MEHHDGSIDIAVDDLLAAVEIDSRRTPRVGEMTVTRNFPMGPVTVTHPVREERVGEATGVYDLSFFQKIQDEQNPIERRKTGFESLDDARVGLGLFLDEAEQALASPDLTVDQRLHIATIVSYIDGLAKRFDRVKVPGFVQKKH